MRVAIASTASSARACVACAAALLALTILLTLASGSSARAQSDAPPPDVAASAAAATEDTGTTPIAIPVWASAASFLLPFGIALLIRKRPVGGWLFVYVWEATGRALVAFVIGPLANSREFAPGLWPSKAQYAAFLVTQAPSLLAAVEMVVAFGALRRKARRPPDLERLRRVLWAQVIAGLLAVWMDSMFWKSNLVLSVPGTLVWPAIWLPYFHRSRRVARVFGVVRDTEVEPGAGVEPETA